VFAVNQNKIKRVAIMPYLLLCALATLHSSFALISGTSTPLAWAGALLATAPMLGFMIYLALSGKSSTSRYMPWQLGSAVTGAGLIFIQFNMVAAAYAWGVGLAGVSLYIFWYSNLGRSSSLEVGQVLPSFKLKTAQSGYFTEENLKGSPALLLFYRGNWCPLCVAQVAEIAEQYRELSAIGVQCLMISTQARQETEKLARRFDMPLIFLIDDEFELSKTLGTLHQNGAPAGMGLQSPDTSYPTVILTDADNRIVWLDQTDNYRVRPDPGQYLDIFEAVLQKQK
jgi:peroxiredoxin